MMGGTVDRVSGNLITTFRSSAARSSNSSSSSNLSPRLLPVDKLLPSATLTLSSSSSSSFVSSSPSASVTSPHHQATIRSRAHICSLLWPPLPRRKSSASNTLALSALSSLSCCVSFSAAFPGSSQPCGSLMSSRLAPAYSSFCGLTGLEGLIFAGSGSSRSRHHHLVPAGLSDCWGWRKGRGVGGGTLKSRCMDTEKNVQRIECYSSSSQAAGGGGDHPVSSVLPPLPASPAVSKVKGMTISFCPRCGGATEEKIPVGEHEKRYVCTACGAVHYQNPKMVVGCLVEHEGKILLCRRNIEPSFGLWTLPAGYMEMGESAAEGAARETLEEACANVQVLGLFAHIDIPLIGQSHIYFRAQMKDPHFAPGPESIECALFNQNDIPFDNVAFSSIQVALKMYVEDTEAGKMRVHHAVIDKRPGASPSDLRGFVVRDVLTS